MQTILICNVSPSPAVVHSGPLGKFEVPGKPRGDGQRYGFLKIPAVLKQGEDAGKGKLKKSLEVDPLDFANECVRPREHRGFFVALGEPTEKQIEDAERRMRVWYGEQILKGDELAAMSSFSLITRSMREACAVLGEKRTWADVQNQTMKRPCGACRTLLDPAAAVCGTCGAILDAEKAAKFGLAVPAHMLREPEPEPEVDEPEADNPKTKARK